MYTNWCILVEISVKIRMMKILRSINESYVPNGEFHFTNTMNGRVSIFYQKANCDRIEQPLWYLNKKKASLSIFVQVDYIKSFPSFTLKHFWKKDSKYIRPWTILVYDQMDQVNKLQIPRYSNEMKGSLK